METMTLVHSSNLMRCVRVVKCTSNLQVPKHGRNGGTPSLYCGKFCCDILFPVYGMDVQAGHHAAVRDVSRFDGAAGALSLMM